MSSLFVIVLVLAAGASLVAQVVWWLSGRPERERVPPPLVYPLPQTFAHRTDAERHPDVATPAPARASPPGAESTSRDVTPLAAATSDVSTNETVQFVRPTDEALQLLPARLEVVSGLTPQQVIRFVRVPGKPAELILGREAASSPQQVTLTSSTVSRRHARVTYDGGRWLVTNLSHTNPVVVNDRALAEFEGPRPLLDGDRIALGDVVLRFCTS